MVTLCSDTQSDLGVACGLGPPSPLGSSPAANISLYICANKSGFHRFCGMFAQINHLRTNT